MRWIVVADKFLVAATEEAVKWLFEWFSLSQRNIETVCIILYMLIGGIGFSIKHDYATLLADGFLSLMMTLRSSFSPKILRSLFRAELASGFRITMIGYALLEPLVEANTPYRLIYAGGFLIYVLFEYIYVAVGTDKKRRRRGRMALAKLKELFSWLPEPLPEGI